MDNLPDGGIVIDDQGTVYYSLTNIARKHSEESPGYVVQSWLRSSNTLEFLRIWEEENNPGFRPQEYHALLSRIKEGGFTLTPKQWIEKTGAIGIVSKQGKSGGTYAHKEIACEFLTWISPKFKWLMIRAFQLSNEVNNRDFTGQPV